jgi:YidC/Oxa1 family membrane protein insertase
VNPLQLLEEPLRQLLDFLHENLDLSYGWAIVVLTVLVRTALLPLVIKQYRSMRQMQMVAPQLKELQRKHKGDRAKTQEELMKFYRENDINPFASCLPLVAQLPIFIALYYVLRDFAEEAQAIGDEALSFMWIISDVSVDFQELGWWSVVPLLAVYGLTQLLSTELSATPNMPESQRKMMRVLPIVIVVFVVNFPVPAGLVLYWMSTNLWTCGQQLVMRHRIGLHLAEVPETTTTGKRSSRTAPKTATALVEGTDESDEVVADADEAADLVEAAEGVEAPEAPEAPEPATAEERPAPAPARGGPPGGASKRRQPRPAGAGGPSRPAPRRSSNKKKR